MPRAAARIVLTDDAICAMRQVLCVVLSTATNNKHGTASAFHTAHRPLPSCLSTRSAPLRPSLPASMPQQHADHYCAPYSRRNARSAGLAAAVCTRTRPVRRHCARVCPLALTASHVACLVGRVRLGIVHFDSCCVTVLTARQPLSTVAHGVTLARCGPTRGQ